MNSKRSFTRAINSTAALAALTVLQFTSAALANDAAILKCRTLTDNTARLTCYDGINASPTAPSTSGKTASTTGVANTTNPADDFGLEAQTPSAQLKRVESRIKGLFNGWEGNAWITLENGQVWQVNDGTSRYLYLQDPKVSVERGPLGVFHLFIEGTNHAPRVKRVK